MSVLRDPTADELITPEFNAIWDAIKTWDIEVPEDGGVSEATGNHVVAIMDSLANV